MATIGAIRERPDRKLSMDISIIGISGILVTRKLGISESRSLKPRQGGKCHRGGQLSTYWRRMKAQLCEGQLSA
jgi:hypothetical protein